MENCNGFLHAVEKKVPSCVDAFQASGAIQWFFGNIFEAFYNFFYVLLAPAQWGAWIPQAFPGLFFEKNPKMDVEAKASLMKFIYYGGSVEFFFVLFTLFLVLTVIGMRNNAFMWGMVRGLEGIANTVGRIFAWAGILMVLQQIIIVFLQRIFTVAGFSLLGLDSLAHDVSWWAEMLKLHNAMIVALCVSYTFVQGGHVRVDLVYSAVSFRTKRMIDMVGSMIFMMPAAVVTWMYSWYFMWRHMVVPNPSATDSLDKLLLKSRAIRWNIETIGFSPNGFDKYFLFKILLIAFSALVFLQSIAFFYRSYLERKEGPASEGKFLNKDMLGDPAAERAAEIH